MFLGAYRLWYLRECLHWTKIPCYVYKIKRQIRDLRERRRREIHRRQQAAESPRIRLQLYENYYKLLKGMKDAGEIRGGLQTRLTQLLGVSERTVRIYKQLSEQLTGREKQHLMRGKLPFVQARALAAERNQKAAILPLLLREICCSDLFAFRVIELNKFSHVGNRKHTGVMNLLCKS